ncbi:hypothetical protein Bhyg_07650, partial [Pseudolycoriella hygida]
MSTHIHGVQEAAYNEFKLNDRIKNRCKVNKNATPRVVFNEECQMDRKSSKNIQFGRRQRTYQRCQRQGIPRNPKTLDEIKTYLEQEEVLNRIGKTLHCEPKMFYQQTVITALFAYCIFASESILTNLPAILNMRIDGTFKVVPAGPFKQLLIICVDVSGHSFPLFYVLLTRKTQAAYMHLFKQLQSKWKLTPMTITTDYERGLRNALRMHYPSAELVGCWFHFIQAIRKRASKISGFMTFLKTDSSAKKLYRKFYNIPLLKDDKINIAFELLKQEASSFGTRFNEFIKYFHDQWILKEGPSSMSVFLQSHRTNNLLESYNSNMKVRVPKSEELIKSNDYAKVFAGGTQVYAKRKKKYRDRDNFINTHQLKFEKGKMSVTEFFDKMGELEDCDVYIEDDDDDEIEMDPLCMLCITNNKTTMLEPCNHLKFCEECVNELMVT